MECFENEFDKTIYFLDANKNKEYALKGNRHNDVAYKIIRDIGIDCIYFNKYDEIVTSSWFLICGGYVMVDEAEEECNQTFWDEPIEKKITTVIYCSAAMNADYIKWIENEYGKGNNKISDAYKTDDIKKKQMIDEIMQVFKEFRNRQKNVREDEGR